MANSNKVFVSPGVYTSEKDLTFVAQSVGVTTLGLVGETLKGPAFEPVLITNFDEFRTFFGTTSPEKDGNGNPKYELPYVAKSYLQESNQLFVTRVLGLTGFKCGTTYGVKTLAGINILDVETYIEESGLSINSDEVLYLTGKTATNGQTIYDYITDTGKTYITDNWFTIGLVPEEYISGLTGNQLSSPIVSNEELWKNTFYDSVTGKVYSFLFIYNGVDFDITRYSYDGTENEYGNICVVTLRSRGQYSGETLNLEITTQPDVQITGSTSIETNPLDDFTLLLKQSITYNCSLNPSSPKYITKVFGTEPYDKDISSFPLYVFEVYPKVLKSLYEKGLIRGLSVSPVYHFDQQDFLLDGSTSSNLYHIFKATSPMVVSEVRGDSVSDLFEVSTISDGNSANYQVKITILNIDLEQLEFDVLVRDFNDTDENMVVLEKFSRCSMNPSLPSYIGRKIGTLDGEYELRSKYIILSMEENHPVDVIPAGFKGYLTKELDGTILGGIEYKTEYYNAGQETGKINMITGEPVLSSMEDKPRRVSLGMSSSVGYDNSLFGYKGKDTTKLTTGFHLSKNASTIVNSATATGFMFDTTPYDLEGSDKGKLNSISYRKFTFAVAGGFDGWDVYRKVRTNSDGYIFGQKQYISGTTENGGVFNPNYGNSDYYSYLQGIETFSNPEAVDINIFATPGINFRDQASLVSQTIDMIENDRADSIYIINSPNVTTSSEVVNELDLANLDSNYSATYWPWIQVRDNDNSAQLYVSPTGEVVRNIALTDNVSYPWFAVAGYSRGLVKSIKAFKKLTLEERDELYKNRINPIATFADTGTIIWGNKTLQIRESALDRINVRRLLLRTRKLISAVAVRLLFEQNDEQVRNEFLRLVNPILDSIKKERGLYDFRVVVSNDPEDIDANTLRGKIYIKPTRSLEFIDVEFIITPTGASFENV